MNIFTKFFSGKKKAADGGGLVLFHTTHDAMRAEQIMRGEDMAIRLVAPPVHMRIGCDLALEFDLIEKMHIERFLEERGLEHIKVTSLDRNAAEPVSMVDITEYPGNFSMVRAGNMKLTFNRNTGIIVNISGGGCPDVPWLYQLLIDRHLDEAPLPSGHGYTLCALMLSRAFEEAKEMYSKG